MHISRIQITGGQDIELGQFSVLVGPNNVGKSQTLHDIFTILANGKDARTTVIQDIVLPKTGTVDDLLDGLKVVEHPTNIDNHQIHGVQANLTGGDTINVNLERINRQFASSESLDFALGNICKFKVSYLDAASRLQVAKATGSYNPNTGPPQNLIQALFGATSDEEATLRTLFKETFNLDIRLDYSGMTELSIVHLLFCKIDLSRLK